MKEKKKKPNIAYIENLAREWFLSYYPYKLTLWNEFDYSVLSKLRKKYPPGRARDKKSYSDVIIMADTETSKSEKNKEENIRKVKKKRTLNQLHYIPVTNYIVAWTISIRAYDINIVTLYGHRPSEFIEALKNLLKYIPGEMTYIYFHNLAYDWTFLQRFLIREFGEPKSQLNVKSHYPLTIEWEEFTLRDSLLLAQRKLEKWANDLEVDHRKAVGYWDYEKIRNQSDEFTPDELIYIENDTLAGVECIAKTLKTLKKNIHSIPLTATGIPRNEVKLRGKENKAHDKYFLPGTPEYKTQLRNELLFHGGYTHGNRHYIGIPIKYMDTCEYMKCMDFKSSYPLWLICGLMPEGGWTECDDLTIEYIISQSKKYGFIFTFKIYDLKLKPGMPMPVIQVSKCLKSVNAIADNGRILEADYVEFYCNSIDLQVIAYEYDFRAYRATDCSYSRLRYLPRWFTDYVFECFKNKEETDKEKDPVLYSINKAKVNSLYGMAAQRPVKPEILQDYRTGEYFEVERSPEELLEYSTELYEKWKNNPGNVLLYTTGIWVTSYAQRALFELARACKNWIYSDTDSIYGYGWDRTLIDAYNERVKKLLVDRGYGPVINAEGKESWLGIADLDKDGITEFVTLGAKRYCYRDSSGKLKITVAGVPKKGVKCLNDNIDNFKPGMLFSGLTTGKKIHSYIIVEDIYTDERGNEVGDSIDLNPCDYLLDQTDLFTEDDFNALFEDEIISEVDIYAFESDETE